MEESIFFDSVRSLFALIDRGIYNLITLFYSTLIDLASLQIIENSKIDEFATRIYGFIGIIMFFKVSFSLINYIVNPDEIFDKTKGAGNLIQRIIVTFTLIIIVPFAFDLLYEAQKAILVEDNIIPKLILGVTTNKKTNKKETTDYSDETLKLVMDYEYCGSKKAKVSGIAEYVALATFRPFFQINPDAIKKYPADFYGDSFTTGIENKYCKTSSVSDLLKSPAIYNSPYKSRTTSHIYTVEYNVLVSTVVGIVVALLFLSFCFDAATRTIKLLFLEIIAPIPIISYIEPDSSKNSMFKKWFNEVKNTWLSLFIRLAAVFFAIYIITMFDKINTGGNIWITIFVIIGALIFAKQLPKLIENILGVKIDGGLQLNPFKKFENEALGGAQIGRFARKTTSAVGGGALALGGYIYGQNQAKKNFEKKQAELVKDKSIDVRNKIELDWLNKIASAKNDAQRKLAERTYNFKMKNFDRIYGEQFAEVQEKMKKNEDEYKSKFSNSNPIAAGIASVLRGTNLGFKNESKDISSFLKNSYNAATEAAKIKNYNDAHQIKDRFNDFLTDVGGVKNESGTTSLKKKEFKQIDERLKDIGNYLSQNNVALAGVLERAPGAITYEKTIDGKMKMKSSDTFDYASAGISRANVDELIKTNEMLRAEETTANKQRNEINEYMQKNNK